MYYVLWLDWGVECLRDIIECKSQMLVVDVDDVAFHRNLQTKTSFPVTMV